MSTRMERPWERGLADTDQTRWSKAEREMFAAMAEAPMEAPVRLSPRPSVGLPPRSRSGHDEALYTNEGWGGLNSGDDVDLSYY